MIKYSTPISSVLVLYSALTLKELKLNIPHGEDDWSRIFPNLTTLDTKFELEDNEETLLNVFSHSKLEHLRLHVTISYYTQLDVNSIFSGYDQPEEVYKQRNTELNTLRNPLFLLSLKRKSILYFSTNIYDMQTRIFLDIFLFQS
jgi:hypothetical protein